MLLFTKKETGRQEIYTTLPNLIHHEKLYIIYPKIAYKSKIEIAFSRKKLLVFEDSNIKVEKKKANREPIKVIKSKERSGST